MLVVGLTVVSAGAVTIAGPDAADGIPSRPDPPAAASRHLDAPTSDVPRTTTTTVDLPSTGRPPTAPAPAAPAGEDLPRADEPMDAAVPVRLQVASLGVDTALVDLGLHVDGSLEVPADGSSAGWYIGAPTPGELGPAVIAGHVDWGGRPGVFSDLHDLSPGDRIEVTRQDGSTAQFRTARVDRFAKGTFPTEMIYGDIDHAGLRLITCGGDFDRDVGSYVDNVVVFAELVGSEPAPPTGAGRRSSRVAPTA